MCSRLQSNSNLHRISLAWRGTLHGGVALLEKFDDVFERDIHLPGLGEEGVDPLGEDLDPFAAGQGEP